MENVDIAPAPSQIPAEKLIWGADPLKIKRAIKTAKHDPECRRSKCFFIGQGMFPWEKCFGWFPIAPEQASGKTLKRWVVWIDETGGQPSIAKIDFTVLAVYALSGKYPFRFWKKTK